MYALGMLLQTYDADGQPEHDSTWNYKIPSAACIPREINIRLREVLSSNHGCMMSLVLVCCTSGYVVRPLL